MIEHPVLRGCEAYIIQLTDDSCDDIFAHPSLEIRDSFPATIIYPLKFGRSYLWRFAGIKQGKRLTWNGPYAFTIKTEPLLINANQRLNVEQNDSLANAGGLIASDGLHCILDREGNPVWFFPDWKFRSRKGAGTENITLTKAGTITTLGAQNALELDLNGKTLWSAPAKRKDKVLNGFGDFYNHDFTRLSNGHYMILAIDPVWKKLPATYDVQQLVTPAKGPAPKSITLGDGAKGLRLKGEYILRTDRGGNEVLLNMGALLEYNKKDSLVWSWKADAYLNYDDVFPKGAQLDSAMVAQEPHMNGFCVDSKNEYVYASFKTLSRVVKIEKSTGKVVNSWGLKMPSGEAKNGKNFFRKQHAPFVLENGNFGVFDNADMHAKDEPSSIRIFTQPTGHRASKLVWQFDCKFDTAMVNNKSTRGGNVDVLPNGNYLVCMGGVNRIFEITKDKKIVWNALTEKNPHKKGSLWAPLPAYRAHYSSSLYPCYFAIGTNRDTVERSDTSFSIKIYNAGTDADTYTVSLSYVTKGGGIIAKNSGLISGRSSSVLSLSLGSLPSNVTKVNVSVKSDINPDNERKTSIVINRGSSN